MSITSYDDEHVAVDGRRLHESFILTPHRLIENWSAKSLDTLTKDDIRVLTSLSCPIVLLGTGKRQNFPSPDLLRELIERNIGVEVMDNFAACRTYNILIAESREVALAVMLNNSEQSL